MSIHIITSFVVIMLTIMFIVFNAPYWEGKKMYGIAKNGIWRLLYFRLSGLGHKLYQGIELLVHEVTLQFIGRTKILDEKKAHPVLINTINLTIYCIAMCVLANIYEYVCNYIVGTSQGVELFASGDSIRHEESIYIFMAGMCSFVKLILVNMRNSSSFLSSLLSVFATLGKILLLASWNIVYYSIMYGMLHYKLNEIKFTKYLKLDKPNSAVSEVTLFQYFIGKIRESIYSWLDEKTILKNVFIKNKNGKERLNVGELFIFSFIIFIFVWLLNAFGAGTLGMWEFIYTIIDELKLLDIFLSFLITLIIALFFKKSFTYGITKMPDTWQEEIQVVSIKAEAEVTKIQNRRETWCNQKDNIVNKDSETYFSLRPRHRNRQHPQAQRGDGQARDSQKFEGEVHATSWGETNADDGKTNFFDN